MNTEWGLTALGIGVCAIVLVVLAVLYLNFARNGKPVPGNWLAGIFDWNREVIEAAETPFAKLAIFVLPILSPIVPAFMTALHVYKLMGVIFPGAELQGVRMAMAGIVGVVLELLGYVGAVAFIQAIGLFVKEKSIAHAVPIGTTGLAYGFYIVAMILINFQLGEYFDTPEIVNKIVGLLSLITVPSGLLAANHLTQKEDNEQAYTLRQEQREDRLKEKAMKRGFNIFGGGDSTPAPRKPHKEKPASHFKDRIPVMLDEHYASKGKVMELTEITAELKINHARNKGFVHTQRKEWAAARGISLEKPKKGDGFTIPR